MRQMLWEEKHFVGNEKCENHCMSAVCSLLLLYLSYQVLPIPTNLSPGYYLPSYLKHLSQ